MAIAGSQCWHTTFDFQTDDVLEEDVPPYEDRDGEAQVAELSDEPFDRTVHSGPKGTEFARDLISSALDLLTPGWEAYLIASSLSDLEGFVGELRDLGLSVTVLGKRHVFFEDIVCLKVKCGVPAP